MTDESKPTASLPNPVEVRDILLIRAPWGYRPTTACSDGRSFPNLHSAVNAALSEYEDAHLDRETVWIRAGTGAGAAILDIQGVLLLKAAMAEGGRP